MCHFFPVSCSTNNTSAYFCHVNIICYTTAMTLARNTSSVRTVSCNTGVRCTCSPLPHEFQLLGLHYFALCTKHAAPNKCMCLCTHAFIDLIFTATSYSFISPYINRKIKNPLSQSKTPFCTTLRTSFSLHPFQKDKRAKRGNLTK